MYYTYILKSKKDNNFYIGSTKDYPDEFRGFVFAGIGGKIELDYVKDTKSLPPHQILCITLIF